MRFHLHYVAGRAEERLTFDLQPVVGARMGYTRHGRQDGVERFMRHYFLTAREVARLTRILEPAILRAALGPPAIAAETDAALVEAGFVLAEGKLLPIAGRDFDDEPIQMLRILQVARDRGLELHPLAHPLADPERAPRRRSARRSRTPPTSSWTCCAAMSRNAIAAASSARIPTARAGWRS